jgi:hypothetical protein
MVEKKATKNYIRIIKRYKETYEYRLRFSLALQRFVGPWPHFQFLEILINR